MSKEHDILLERYLLGHVYYCSIDKKINKKGKVMMTLDVHQVLNLQKNENEVHKHKRIPFNCKEN